MSGRDPEMMARIEAMIREWDHKQEKLLEEYVYDFIEAELRRSLRDWFAGQALAGMLGNSAMNNLDPERPLEVSLAESAYLTADAMLAERSKAK